MRHLGQLDTARSMLPRTPPAWLEAQKRGGIAALPAKAGQDFVVVKAPTFAAPCFMMCADGNLPVAGHATRRRATQSTWWHGSRIHGSRRASTRLILTRSVSYENGSSRVPLHRTCTHAQWIPIAAGGAVNVVSPPVTLYAALTAACSPATTRRSWTRLLRRRSSACRSCRDPRSRELYAFFSQRRPTRAFFSRDGLFNSSDRRLVARTDARLPASPGCPRSPCTADPSTVYLDSLPDAGSKCAEVCPNARFHPRSGVYNHRRGRNVGAGQLRLSNSQPASAAIAPIR